MRKKKVTQKAMLGELRSLAMIGGGMVLGTLGGKAIDKALKVDDSLPGFQVKKLVRPAVQLGAGVVGSLQSTNSDVKMLSAGVGAAGVVSTVKVVLKKDLLNGLGGAQPLALYNEPPALPSRSYELDLPELLPSSPGERPTASIAATDYEEIEII